MRLLLGLLGRGFALTSFSPGKKGWDWGFRGLIVSLGRSIVCLGIGGSEDTAVLTK